MNTQWTVTKIQIIEDLLIRIIVAHLVMEVVTLVLVTAEEVVLLILMVLVHIAEERR